ncbi:ATP-binding cassette subfamily G (WHITE) member 2 [Clonorchis sinensis]|uniref:ATP-binding cassette subfamily G (WHITE) member 2 n=1 Tax=Clonorchis sinensis TaxID=79923 RepID=G7YT00_CLOSI|nr:ATP-binding cassette subfamily G (WHITE) member 2 [Clonorchis sinensis]
MPICYWMAGLLPEVGAFFYFELLLSITTLAAAAIALFMSATFTLFGIANVVVSILFVFMMVFGGYLINLKSMAAWLSWLRYLSIFRYSMGGLLTAEMRSLTFCPVTNTSVPGAPDNRQCQSGTLYLRDQDLPYATAWDLWSNVFGQVLIMIFFYILCYVQLRRINKYK